MKDTDVAYDFVIQTILYKELAGEFDDHEGLAKRIVDGLRESGRVIVDRALLCDVVRLWRRPPANLTAQAEAWSKLAEVCVWTEERP